MARFTRHNDSLVTSRAGHAVALATKNDEETITVDVAKGDRSNTRTFVAFVHGWRPRGAAKEAYEAHTKRAHDGNAEELRLFFEVSR